MVAMVPETFPDGGPMAGLEGVSAWVSGSFSYIPPTDFCPVCGIRDRMTS